MILAYKFRKLIGHYIISSLIQVQVIIIQNETTTSENIFRKVETRNINFRTNLLKSPLWKKYKIGIYFSDILINLLADGEYHYHHSNLRLMQGSLH